MPSWQVSRGGRAPWEISLSSPENCAGRCGPLPSSRHRRGSCREGRPHGLPVFDRTGKPFPMLARLVTLRKAAISLTGRYRSGRATRGSVAASARFARARRRFIVPSDGLRRYSCLLAPIGWKQSQQNRPVIKFGPAERLPSHSERSVCFTKVLCLQCRHRAMASDCDSHPKMLYRVTAIYRSVTEADVFPH